MRFKKNLIMSDGQYLIKLKFYSFNNQFLPVYTHNTKINNYHSEFTNKIFTKMNKMVFS